MTTKSFSRRGFLGKCLALTGAMLLPAVDLLGAKEPIRKILPEFGMRPMSKSEWMALDSAVLRAARQRMRAWADITVSNFQPREAR